MAFPMQHSPHLLALATAVPAFELGQAEVKARAEVFFKKDGIDIRRLLPVFENAGIARRFSCVPIEWYVEPHGWAARNRLFLEHAVDLLEEAARNCLEKACLTVNEIDAIVAVSSTGIATPSLDALLMERLGTRRDVTRLPIFGLGCAGGVLGLSRAAALAQAVPGSRVLFLVVELCTLTFRAGDHSKSNVVAAALFGDGAAAALLSTDGDGPVLGAAGEYTWPQSLDVMGWHVEDDGLGVLFSRDIPALVRARYRAALDQFISKHGLPFESIDSFVCHPGGAKVIDALEEVFGLQTGSLRDCREVLRDYGNMSAATVLFVLERTLKSGMRGRRLVSALGPGFTAAFQILEG
jgi:alkylresorcinol/alkylpyrone synthase